jgi:hypothetical protein
VEPPDQAAKGLLLAAAQSSQEFRLIELGLTHEGLTTGWCLLGDPRSVRNASARAESPGFGQAGERDADRADLSRHERTGDRLHGACDADPDARRHVAASVALRGMSAVFRPGATDGHSAWKPSAWRTTTGDRGWLACSRPRAATARSLKAATPAQLTGSKRRTGRHSAYYSRDNIGDSTAAWHLNRPQEPSVQQEVRLDDRYSVRISHDSQG